MRKYLSAVCILCLFLVFSPAVFSGAKYASLSPVSITACAGYDSKVFLEWQKSPDAGVLYYNVFRSTNTAVADAALAGQVYDNKFIDSSLANLINYYYWVQPVSSELGGFSQAGPVAPFALPFPPSGLSYEVPTVSSPQFTLTWLTSTSRASYDISGYNVYRSTAPITSGGDLGFTYNSPYTDTTFVPYTRYYYQVRTIDVKSNSSAAAGFTLIIPGKPSTPTNVFAAPNGVSATVSWDYNSGSEGVYSYQIYRDSLSIGDSSNNSYNDSSVISGSSYLYSVIARNSYGNSDMSAAAAVTIVPSAPQNLTVLRGTTPGTLSLSWTALSASENITGYNVYRATGPVSFDYSAPIITVSTFYDDAAVVPGQQYYYSVSAFYTIEGARSITKSAVPVSLPPAVSGLSGAVYNNYAAFAWANSLPAYDVTGYKIYKSTDPSPDLFTHAASTTATVNSCNVTGLTILDRAYYLKVTSVNFYGESDTTTAAYIDITMTAGAAPARPENVIAASLGDGGINLTWNAAPDYSGVTSYNVYRRTSSGAYNYLSPYAVAVSNNYADTGAAAGAVYYYEIKAEANSAESLSSVETSGRAVNRPNPATNLTGTYVGGRIYLLWDAPAQAGTDDFSPRHYNIYRSASTVFPTTPLAQGTSVTGEKFLDEYIDAAAEKYYYKIRTVDSNGFESADSDVIAVDIASAQNPPSTFIALAGDGKVTLIWRMVTPLFYNIYRSEVSNTYGPPIAYNVSFSLKDYTDTGLSNGVTYYYIIKAVNSAGEGTPSAEVHAKPYVAVKLPADPAINAQIFSKKEVFISWNPAIGSTLASYLALRSSDGGGSYTQITDTTQTNYTDTDTQWNKIYYYMVKTVDVDGNTDAVYTPVKIAIPQPANKIRVYSNLINLSKNDRLKLRYVLTQSGRIKIRIYTLSGAFVNELADADITGAIDTQNPYESPDFYWDGKNRDGVKVGSGVYIISLETPGSRVIEKVAVVK